MNFALHGYPVSGGITVGYAHLVSTARLEVAHYEIAEEAIEAEVARFDRAMAVAQDELAALRAHIPPGSPPEFEAFLDLHRMILNDSALAQAPRQVIRQRRANAEWALVQQMERGLAEVIVGYRLPDNGQGPGTLGLRSQPGGLFQIR